MTDFVRPAPAVVKERALPSRFERPSRAAFLLYVVAVALFVLSVEGARIDLWELVSGAPNMARVLGEMFPPSPQRLWPVLRSLAETFQMAFAGTVIGVLLSVPFAILASRRHSPHPLLYYAARGVISLFRTVPDLFWALFFVATVGLGPFAGTLTLIVDTIGFCGRFFAESLEEADEGPQEALTALGATRTGVIFSAVMPATMPAMIATSLFSLEKATRSSVVLGLVGAGGIGMELKVSMDMFEYSEACTIIAAVFALVLVVEQVSQMLRRRVMQA
jgi:phosphonate transport system permease protein